ncbi:hypothetical protein ISF_06032 [Cordyceps fumosorosea ARSEF 2679]|uniref:Uncharacterized protein n=1 Tax=Cordyceps fumosorosea (strain ARSEF 2679) TaxID=1081104 RepID=A0A167SX63_CORFA|nr:hypothetical protein ISF_06032 [Cordyceps fumosorosea ARSEF 2679]OAA60021.1 hypothetical protein ISF_06032 [Cordyceps fumosorosea ARSEF 2679]
MQLSHITLLLNAVAMALAKNPVLGNRWIDHNCKVLHSKPHQLYHVNECIELKNINSLSMTWPGDCYLYDGHQCTGKVVAEFTTDTGDGEVGHNGGAFEFCYDTSRGRWPKAKSFKCLWKD